MDDDLSALSSPRSRYLTHKLFFDPPPVHPVHRPTKFDELNLDAHHRHHIVGMLRHVLGISVPTHGLYDVKKGGSGGMKWYDVDEAVMQNERVVVVKGRNKTKETDNPANAAVNAAAAGGGGVEYSASQDHQQPQQQHPNRPLRVSEQEQGLGLDQEHGSVDDNDNTHTHTATKPHNSNMAINILHRRTTNLQHMKPQAVAALAADNDNHKEGSEDNDKDLDKREVMNINVHIHTHIHIHPPANIDIQSLGQPVPLASPTSPTHLLTPIALKKFKQLQGQGLDEGQGLGQGQELNHDGVVMMSEEEEKETQQSEFSHHNHHHQADHNHRPGTSTPTNIRIIDQNHLLHNLLARPTTNPTLQQLLATPLEGDTSHSDDNNKVVLAGSNNVHMSMGNVMGGHVMGGNLSTGHASGHASGHVSGFVSIAPSRPDSPLHTTNLYNGRTKEVKRG